MTEMLIIDAVCRPRGLGRGVRIAIFDLQRDEGEALASETGAVFCEVNDTSKESSDASVCYPKRLGEPGAFAPLALAMLENGYRNGRDARFDGAIRMVAR